MMRRLWTGALLALFCGCACAADQAAAPLSPAAGLLQIFLGLAAVLALMGFAAWFFKKLGPVAGSGKLPVKVVGGVNIGNRERVMVIEVADQWIVVGVTSNQINALTTLPKREISAEQGDQSGPPFADWLKRTIAQRKDAQ